MNIKWVVCAVGLLIAGPALPQSNLTSQIDAVNIALAHQKDDERAAAEARAEQYRQRRIAQQEESDRQERVAAAGRAREQARLDRIAADRRVAQAKSEAYQDQLRDMELQEKRMDLQTKQTRVNRENDMIDQQLKREAAQTDLVQSNADANRNISEGGKSLLEDTGKARVKDASGWFK